MTNEQQLRPAAAASASAAEEAVAQPEPDICEFIPPPTHRRVMPAGTFPRPSYRNSLTTGASYAAVLYSNSLGLTPRSFFNQAAAAAAASASAAASSSSAGSGETPATTNAAAGTHAAATLAGDQGTTDNTPAGFVVGPRTATGRQERLPSIHGLFSHTVGVERKMCSLEYWLSIFGTTGGTVRAHHRGAEGGAGAGAGPGKQFPIEVMNGLFVGDDTCADSLHALADYNIRLVINAAAADKYVPLRMSDPASASATLRKSGVTYLPLDGLLDSAACEILPHLAPACVAIAKARKAGEGVLVCSSKGTNRSVCIVMAYVRSCHACRTRHACRACHACVSPPTLSCCSGGRLTAEGCFVCRSRWLLRCGLVAARAI
jgi:hypothetical protein